MQNTRLKATKRNLTLGDLVSALYDEAGKVVSERRLRACLAYLALIDLKPKARARNNSHMQVLRRSA